MKLIEFLEWYVSEHTLESSIILWLLSIFIFFIIGQYATVIALFFMGLIFGILLGGFYFVVGHMKRVMNDWEKHKRGKK